MASANGNLYTTSANSFAIPADARFVEFTAPSGAISASITTTPLLVGTVIQISMPTSNAAGLTITTSGGVTIMGSTSYLLPTSNAAPGGTNDRAWQLRVVAPNTLRVA